MEELEKQLSDATSKPKTVRSSGASKHNYSPGNYSHVHNHHMIAMYLIEKKGSRKMHKDRSRSPSPRNISFSGSSSTFPSFGRWTAHRAYVKKV